MKSTLKSCAISSSILVSRGVNWRWFWGSFWVTHYGMKVLIREDLLKMGNFSYNKKKKGYTYHLSPGDSKSKTVLTAHFLECKVEEHAMLKIELQNHENDIQYLECVNKIRVV